jgi:trehalose 6-phosphate phosphatase
VERNVAPIWPKNPAVFLDLDGTLLDFALDPAAVLVSAPVHQLLGRLKSAANGAVAIVSGRTLDEVDRLLGAGRFPVAAVHGLERRNAAGEISRVSMEFEEIDRARGALEQIVRRYPRTHLEHKGIALALHYRRCPELESRLVELLKDRLERIGTGLRLLRGNLVLELKPATRDKGTAIAAFMNEAPFTGRTPVFVGDDITDEDGFRTINELDGVSVKVGPGTTCAKHRLPDNRCVIDWLSEFAVAGRQ